MNTIQTILKKYFGYEQFRPLQREIIEHLLGGNDALVLMPTGSGKSLCYQVPALMLDGTALIISPLIALMKDQVGGLKANGIAAEFLNSSLDADEEKLLMRDCVEGKVKILYLSPEKVMSISETFLKNLNVSLIAIDEAHCISQWGHDFRPEYSQLKILRNLYPAVPLIALTATADKVTRKDIIRQLGINSDAIFISSFDRPNLSLSVRQGLSEKEKMSELLGFIKKKPNESGIIYCLSRKKTEQVCARLLEHGISASFYHAGMESADRSRVQEEFIKDNTKIICATIAFGMGIDKSNIRWVVHFNLPKNLEGYYQEIGRSGRDGLPGDTVLYYSLGDLIMLTKFAAESGQPELNKEKLLRMQQYAESGICRRRILLNYFGESFIRNCGNCDVCANPPSTTDGTIAAQKALSAVARTNESIGVMMLIYVLRGSHNSELLEKGFDKLKTYGCGKEYSFETWKIFILQFIQLGLLEMAYDEGYTLKITSHGKDILKGNEKVSLVIPRQGETPVPKQRPARSETNPLFEELRSLRKLIADSEGLPPYIIFNDKTLSEMSIYAPHTRAEMLKITGVSENKMIKYGSDFLKVTSQYSQTFSKNNNDNGVAEVLNNNKLNDFIAEMRRKNMRLTHHTLGKILLGSGRKSVPAGAESLSFFGILKDTTTYKNIGPVLKKYFEENKILNQFEEHEYFNPPHFNHFSNIELSAFKSAIKSLGIKRPDSTITNAHMLELRKNYPRAYEPWVEEEIRIYSRLIEKTNDPAVLSSVLGRNNASVTAYYSKVTSDK
jgi:ATP-dependent DNA helicase RecQ